MSSELSEPIETTAATEERSAPRQPYPGLRPFKENEQRLFFGRDHQIREILERLQQTYFAVVIGGSGSGKSSIITAGVVPALRKKQLRGSGDFWLAARFTPQQQPLRHLATALSEFIEPKPGQSPDDTIADIEQTLLETNSLAGFLRRYRSRLKLEEGQAPESRETANLLIFCDQFEEVFREQNRDNPETRQLVDLIVEAYRNRDDYPQLYVIIGMRSEDLHRCAEFIDLPGVVNKASYLTRRLDEIEIASAIIEPIRLVLRLRGIRPRRFEPVDVDPWPFEVDLLRRLNKAVSNLAYDPDHLPLLQHLLSVLWRQVDAKLAAQGEKLEDPAAAEAFRVTADDLAPALGFATIAEADEFARRNKLPDSWILGRALDHAAEGVMPRDDRLRRIAEMMFRLLAWENDRGIYSRRWTSRKEIADVTRDMAPRKRGGIAGLMHALRQRLRGKDAEDQDRPASDDEIETVIAAFSAPYPFLNDVRTGREGKIDVSHEAFIRNWKTFRAWLSDERSLASAFKSLRTAYASWSEKLRDPHRRWLGWLSGIFGDILSRERLQEMRGWWIYRSRNAAWAAVHPEGVDSEEAEAEQRPSRQISEDELRQLRRYYWKSLALRHVMRAGPLVLLALVVVAGGIAYDFRQRATLADVQLRAGTVYDDAEATGEELARVYVPDSQVRANDRISAIVTMMERLRKLQEAKDELEKYRRLRRFEDFGSIEKANLRLDKVARDAMGKAMWPAPRVKESSVSNARLRPECRMSIEEFFRKSQTEPNFDEIVETLAPLEPNDGKHLLQIQSGDAFFFFVLPPKHEKCSAKYVFTLSIPPNNGGKWSLDPEIGLIAVNVYGEGGKYDKTHLYRLTWNRVRQCRSDDGTQKCDVDFWPRTVEARYDDGPYKVADSSHVKTEDGRFYELGRDQDFRLLKRNEAEDARKAIAARVPAAAVNSSAGSASGTTVLACDSSGAYLALLTGFVDEKGGVQSDLVRVFNKKGDQPCEDYVNDRAIMSFDLDSYAIETLAFAHGMRAIDDDDDVPAYIDLQGGESDLIYRLAWKPAKLRSMLCDALRRQKSDNRVPSRKERLSGAVQAILSAKDNPPLEEICRLTWQRAASGVSLPKE